MDASDWMKGIFFSVLASVIGAGSKLAIRKSWLMEETTSANDGEYREPSSFAHHQQQQRQQQSSNPNEPSENGQPPPPPRRDDEPLQPARRRADSRSYYTAIRSDGPPSPGARNKNTSSGGAEAPGGALDSEDILTEEAAHLEIESSPLSRRCCTLPHFLRFSGMIGMTFLNPACCLLAMNYATPSILAPFSGLTLVWVIVLSRPLIGESPSCAQRVASTLIVVGEVMVAVFGDHSNDAGTTTADVVASYKELSFILFFVASALWIVLLAVWMKYSTSPKLKRFAWGTSGGSITGLAQNFIKDSLVVVKATPTLRQVPWYVYFFVFNGIACSFAGLLFLTACMKRYDATYSAAMFVGSFVVSTSIMAASHYHTFEHLTDLVDYIMYPTGLVVLMIGVCILVQATQAYTLDSEPDDSDRIILTNGRYGDDEIYVDDDATPVAASLEVASPSKATAVTADSGNGGSQTVGVDELI